MLKYKQVFSDVVVFSQWSRKSYAVFASLKKVVSIGHLSIDICKSSLLKSATLIRLLNTFSADNSDTDEYDINELLENASLLLAELPLISAKNDIYIQEKIISNNLRKPIFCSMQSMGFLF
jgi:hypothetical protein